MPVLKHMEIVTDADKLQVDIQEVCKSYSTIKHWAYILHDKDDTRPHYHIYVHFGGSSVPTELVASWFKVPENFVNKIKGRRVDMLLYLTHGNDTQQYKYQYSPNEIVANFDVGTEIKASKVIGDFENFSYAQQLQYVNTLPIAEKSKVFGQLKKLWELHCQCLTLQADRNIQVVFISGKGGTGKTTYAKRLCNALKYDFCVSSSSNDPFQDYLGQKVMILDDLRDRTFELEDLLKVLDNHTSSSVKSRFNNKVFNGEMIIITSSVPLKYWYPKFNRTYENLVQLYRRVSCYIEITAKDISIYDEGVDNSGSPRGYGEVLPNDLVVTRENREERRKISSVFKDMGAKQLNVFDESSDNS